MITEDTPNSGTFRFLTVLIGWSAILLAGAAWAADFESKTNRTFTVDRGGKFLLEADQGGINVRTVDKNELTVEVTRKVVDAKANQVDEVLSRCELTFEQKGNDVVVKARVRRETSGWLGRAPRLELRFDVTVPSVFNLDLKTSAGSISGGDITGALKARTAGGGIDFGKVRGPVELSTSAGSIRLKGATQKATVKTSGGGIDVGEMGADVTAETAAGSIRIGTSKASVTAHTSGGGIDAGHLLGPAELVTSAGSIHVKNVEGKLRASTSGGGIRIDEARQGVQASTAAGSINACISGQPESDCQFTTSGGAIRLRLDPELRFDVDASASGGRVSTELPITMTVVGAHKKENLKGKLNGGGPALVLRTSAGNVSIEKK